MTTQEFNYFVLNTAETWRTGATESLRILPDGGLALWPVGSVTPPEGLRRLVGLAADGRGTLYLLDAEACQVVKYSPAQDQFTTVPCIGGCGSQPVQFDFFDAGLNTYAGRLALNASILYVADTFNHRVQAFYRRNLQLRFVLGAVEKGHPVPGTRPGTFNAPRDIVLGRKGAIYVLDYGNYRIQQFDRNGQFQAFVGPQVEWPTSLARDQEGSLYVLDRGQNKVWKFDSKGQLSQPVVDLTTASRPFTPSGLAVDADHILYVGEEGNDDLAFFVWDEHGRYLGSFDNPHGTCRQLFTDAQGRLFALCGEHGTLVRLNGKKAFLPHGVYYSKRFDSTKPGTIWHRLEIDAHIPERTKIDVHYHVSEDLIGRQIIEDTGAWKTVLSSPHNGMKSRDGLLMNAKGRYLQLKIELFSDAGHTPVIRRLHVYFPRLSYLRYLPATYQEDPTGRDFLERFLSLFETISAGMEHQIIHLSRHFDAEATPDEFLNWLGFWLAIARDDQWSMEQKRTFLEQAYTLYKQRGTLNGLGAMIELFTGTRPMIIEHFKTRRPMVLGAGAKVGRSTVVGRSFNKPLILEESSTIGAFVLNEQQEPPQKPFEADAFDFTLVIDTSTLKDAEQEEALRRLIEEEKPAHTRPFIRTSRQADMQLGLHTLVEVDTRLACGYPSMRLGKGSILGKKTFLGTKYPEKGIIGARSRVAIDTVLH